MHTLHRRMLLAAAAGLALAPSAPAHAVPWEMPPAAARHPAYRRWDRARAARALPLDMAITNEAGRPMRLRDWLGGGPAVLAVWATWCGPCLRESPDLARISERLQSAGSPVRVRALQAFDSAAPRVARATLQRLNAESLLSARATPAAERALIQVFGASPSDPTRITLPSLLLIAPDGRELGRSTGLLEGVDGDYTYWRDQETFEFLMRMSA